MARGQMDWVRGRRGALEPHVRCGCAAACPTALGGVGLGLPADAGLTAEREIKTGVGVGADGPPRLGPIDRGMRLGCNLHSREPETARPPVEQPSRSGNCKEARTGQRSGPGVWSQAVGFQAQLACNCCMNWGRTRDLTESVLLRWKNGGFPSRVVAGVKGADICKALRTVAST